MTEVVQRLSDLKNQITAFTEEVKAAQKDFRTKKAESDKRDFESMLKPPQRPQQNISMLVLGGFLALSTVLVVAVAMALFVAGNPTVSAGVMGIGLVLAISSGSIFAKCDSKDNVLSVGPSDGPLEPS